MIIGLCLVAAMTLTGDYLYAQDSMGSNGANNSSMNNGSASDNTSTRSSGAGNENNSNGTYDATSGNNDAVDSRSSLDDPDNSYKKRSMMTGSWGFFGLLGLLGLLGLRPRRPQ